MGDNEKNQHLLLQLFCLKKNDLKIYKNFQLFFGQCLRAKEKEQFYFQENIFL